MKTQRIVFDRVSTDHELVYSIQQYNPDLNDWFDIGTHSTNYQYIQNLVNSHNQSEVMSQAWKEITRKVVK